MCDFTHFYLFPAWSGRSTPLALTLCNAGETCDAKTKQDQKIGPEVTILKTYFEPFIVRSVALQAFIGPRVPWGLPVEEVTAPAAQKPAT